MNTHPNDSSVELTDLELSIVKFNLENEGPLPIDVLREYFGEHQCTVPQTCLCPLPF